MSNPAAFSVQHDINHVHTCGCRPVDWNVKSEASSLSSPPSEELKASSIDPAVIKTIETRLDELDPELRKLSLDIHSHPELAWEEVYAHEQMSSFMEKHGFTVSRKHAGLKTAWRADFMYGSGGRVLGINSEMDALPGIGHACGHNLIGICGIGIAVAVKAAMLKHNLSGKIILLGTPAEENGGGKLNLIDNGDYKEMDVCIMAHPGAGEVGSVSDGTLNALQHITVHFNGQGAHAAGAPWDANNALDAAVLAYSSISLLRQQIKPECRIQGIMEGNHWTANVIPDNARLPYIVRAANKSELEDLSSRVQECFRAAAIATGCEVTISLKTPHLDVVQNTALAKDFDENCVARYGMTSNHLGTSASTDFGNVSYVIPALHPLYGIPTQPNGGNHTSLFTTSAAAQEAHDLTMKVAKGLSLTGYRVLSDAAFTAEVKAAYEAQMKIQ